jgi:ABC-type branched-subunit amino acid transport system substrate-binding protein
MPARTGGGFDAAPASWFWVVADWSVILPIWGDGCHRGDQLRATLLALDEINRFGGVNGHEIVLVIYDPQSDAQTYARCAKRLMIEDGVTMIFGCYTSSSRKAVLPVVERLNGLLWYPTLYEGFEFSSNIIYTGAAPNQNSVVLSSYLAQTYGTRFFFVGSDYVYPRESNRVMRELLRARGCTVAGETYLDLRSKQNDFRPVMRRIKDSGADVIFSTVVGDSTLLSLSGVRRGRP